MFDDAGNDNRGTAVAWRRRRLMWLPLELIDHAHMAQIRGQSNRDPTLMLGFNSACTPSALDPSSVPAGLFTS
jgi:hypothetical protein